MIIYWVSGYEMNKKKTRYISLYNYLVRKRTVFLINRYQIRLNYTPECFESVVTLTCEALIDQRIPLIYILTVRVDIWVT